MAVVADLVINKPLGLSPKGIEFKRAHLYDINPVGVGAMGLASVLSVAAYLGVLGPTAQAFSALIALVTAFVAAPLIAWCTTGKYYHRACRRSPPRTLASSGLRALRMHDLRARYEADDMALLPGLPRPHLLAVLLARRALQRHVQAARRSWSAQWQAVLRALLPRRAWPQLEHRARPLPAADGGRSCRCSRMLFYLIYQHELQQLRRHRPAASRDADAARHRLGFMQGVRCAARWSPASSPGGWCSRTRAGRSRRRRATARRMR